MGQVDVDVTGDRYLFALALLVPSSLVPSFPSFLVS
jgi:hypothetical protein